jgi:hypothetical protein
MPAPLTLLAAAGSVRLVKKFTREGVEPYPLAKNLTSFHYETEKSAAGLQERISLLRENARFGYAMLKGPLTRPIVSESRAGLTDNTALTHSLILDIDGWKIDPLPPVVNQQHVKDTAESIVAALPGYMQDVSYIAHASASFGRKPGLASVHLEFILDEPINARQLKIWLRALNLTLETVEPHLRLTKNGHQLSWVVDPSVADNSKIVYIGAPTFDNCPDPFGGEADARWVLVEKDRPTVNLTIAAGQIDRAAVDAMEFAKIKTLRKALGLPTQQPKLQKLTIVDPNTNLRVSQDVLINPAPCTLTLHRMADRFAIFNLDGGDSNAYWCYLNQPDVIYNFKGEHAFLFSKADPEGYDDFILKHTPQIEAVRPTEPLLFRERRSDTYYLGTYNKKEDIFGRDAVGVKDLHPVALSHLEDAAASYGMVVPDVIPTLTIHFNPTVLQVLDRQNQTVNDFELPESLRQPAEIPDEYKGLAYNSKTPGRNGFAAYIRALCPTIHKLIWHLVGNDDTCYEHLLNWLAFCAQERRLSNTAWIFSGTTGTGKGLFMSHVITPIWGDYAAMKKQGNLEDNFNGGLDRLIMVGVDEVHTPSARNPERLLEDLKHLIGSEEGTIRAMRTDQQKATFYCNLMLFSNRTDPLRIEADDRRYNVAPPQLHKLMATYPELEYSITEDLARERPMFASFLMHLVFDARAARTCLNNVAKNNMRCFSASSHERFFDAVQQGELDYFIDNIFVHKPDPQNYTEVQRIATARQIVGTWIADANRDNTTSIPTDELRLVYLAISPDSAVASAKFVSMLRKNGMNLCRMRMADNSRPFGVHATWTLAVYQDQTLLQSALSGQTAQQNQFRPTQH